MNFRFSEEYPYYVYRHIRKDTGEVFYIGRGKKYKLRKHKSPSGEYERAYTSLSRNQHWHNIVNKVGGFDVDILIDCLTFDESLEKEREFVKLYKRATDGGTLCNKNDGGDGNKNVSVKESVKTYLKKLYTKTFQNYLDECVFPEPNTGCWLWAGPLNSRGSPIMQINTKQKSAHTQIFQKEFGTTLKQGQFILRQCDNKFCVNPSHMTIGGFTDRKRNPVRKYTHHKQTLTEEIVLKIRRLRESGLTYKQIREKLNVGEGAVSGVLRGVTWKWL